MTLQYSVPCNKGVASVRTIGAVRADATTLIRGAISEWEVGAVTPTPADVAFDHEIYRVSTIGTGAAVTPSPNDVADTASIADATDTYTVDPTIGVIMKRFGLHQRASMRWVANPGEELIWPATASNGFGGGLAAVSTVDFSGTFGCLTA